MPDESSFHAAVRAAPDDDLVRLAYTDWLEEHANDGVPCKATRCGNPRPGRVDNFLGIKGDYRCDGCRGTGYAMTWSKESKEYVPVSNHFAERAEFIRLQISLFRDFCHECENKRVLLGCAGDKENPPCPRCSPLFQRTQELLDAHLSKWFPPPDGAELKDYHLWQFNLPGARRGEFIASQIGFESVRGFPGWAAGSLYGLRGVPCGHCVGTGRVSFEGYDAASGEMEWGGFRDCRSCQGTGRVGRALERAVAAYPIATVHVRDYTPRYWPVEKIWMWQRSWADRPDAEGWRAPEPDDEESTLPPEVFDALTGGETGAWAFMIDKHGDRRYASYQDAVKDLSDVLLAEARTPVREGG